MSRRESPRLGRKLKGVMAERRETKKLVRGTLSVWRGRNHVEAIGQFLTSESDWWEYLAWLCVQGRVRGRPLARRAGKREG